ncbi:MAG: MBL fold metallo-hydrolase [Myxococcota bacterium]
MSNLTLEILTGGRELSANAFLLRVDHTTLILDAGALHGRSPKWVEQAGEPSAVWLSHVHWDHFGAVRDLRARYPRLPMLATSTTRALAEPALKFGGLDAGRAEAIASTIQRIGLDEYADLSHWSDTSGAEKFQLYPLRGGHIPGAAMLLVEIDLGGEQPHRVLYTSDFCCHDQPLTEPALVPKGTDEFRIDTLIIEGVLATHEDADSVDVSEEFKRLVHAVEAHEGPVLIGAPTLGLGPEVIAALADAGQAVVAHEMFESVLDACAPSASWRERVSFADESACRMGIDAGATVVAPGEQYRNHSAAYRLLPDALRRDDGLVVVLNRARENKLSGRLVRTDVGGKIPMSKGVVMKEAQTHHALLPNHAPRWQIIEAVKSVDPARVVLVHGHQSQLFTLRRAMRKAGVECEICVPGSGDVVELGGDGA